MRAGLKKIMRQGAKYDCPGPLSGGAGAKYEINRLDLFDGDCACFANFNATFTAKTLLGVYRFGFTIDHFKNFYRTNIHTLFTTYAFFFVHNGIESHFDTSPFI